jgi:hypothetical protein
LSPPRRVELCSPLFFRSSLVYEKTDGAVAFMNRLGPFRGETETKTIERKVVVISALNPPDAYSVAGAGGRRRGEFAGTSIVAVAGLEIISIEEPLFHREILSFVSAVECFTLSQSERGLSNGRERQKRSPAAFVY